MYYLKYAKAKVDDIVARRCLCVGKNTLFLTNTQLLLDNKETTAIMKGVFFTIVYDINAKAYIQELPLLVAVVLLGPLSAAFAARQIFLLVATASRGRYGRARRR